VKLFEPNCPAVVEANEEFGCRMSIYEGADMRLDAQFTSGSIVSTPLDGTTDALTNDFQRKGPISMYYK